MNGQVWGQLFGFLIAIALILVGIIFNRQDVKELRLELREEISQLRSDMNHNFMEFYRTIGQHDVKIENLEKRST
jgi:hypothetical protein